MAEMYAAVYRGTGANNKISYESVPIPSIGEGEVLLKVIATGLCMTDVKKIQNDYFEPPRIFGHEIVGVVARVNGSDLPVRVGERVAVFHHVPCDACFACEAGSYAQCETYRSIDTTAGFVPSGGGFAEYIQVPKLVVEKGLVKIPENMSFAQAVFTEPLNCCLKAMELAEIKGGEIVTIIGQGSIGLLFTQLAKQSGATVIVSDFEEYRLKKAKEFGADYCINASVENTVARVKELTSGRGADKVIATPEHAWLLGGVALPCTRPAGRVILFGDKTVKKKATIDIHEVQNLEKQVVGSYSSAPKKHEEALELIQSGSIKVEEMISHIMRFEQLADALDMATTRRELRDKTKLLLSRGRPLKIMLVPPKTTLKQLFLNRNIAG